MQGYDIVSQHFLQTQEKYQQAFDKLLKVTQQHTSQAAIIHAYALSVQNQPPMDADTLPDFRSYIEEFNKALQSATNHADYYLNTLESNMIMDIGNIATHIRNFESYASVILQNNNYQDTIDYLNALQKQANSYQTTSQNIANDLSTLSGKLATDSKNFSSTASDFQNAIVSEKDKVKSMEQEIDTLQQQVNQANEEAALGVLGILGGALLIIVGAVGEVFTDGLSTVAILGGAAIIAAGAAADADAAAKLASLSKKKGQLLTEIHDIQAEVGQVIGIKKGYASLSAHAAKAASAAQDVANAWNLLGSATQSLIGVIKKLKKKLGEGETMKQVKLFIASMLIKLKDILAKATHIYNQLNNIPPMQLVSKMNNKVTESNKPAVILDPSQTVDQLIRENQ